MSGINYLFLGWGESERPALVASLMRFGLDASAEPIVVAVAPAHEEATRTALETLRVSAQIFPFAVADLETLKFDPEATIFWIPDGNEDPRGFLAAIRDWYEERGDELGRIFTIIDCHRQVHDASIHSFYELCIHFSDVLLLGNRDLLSKKEIQTYRDQLKKAAIPCRVEFLKTGGKITHAHELLFPEARRLSLYFDPIEEEKPLDVPLEGFLAKPEEEEEPDPRDFANDPFLARSIDGRWHKILHLPKD